MRSFALPLTALFTGLFTGSLASYSDALQNILKNTDKSDKYHYPTDFTREIVPKPFHSHNDYWRDVPFYSGLSYGAISTEADVWLINGTLYVRLYGYSRYFLFTLSLLGQLLKSAREHFPDMYLAIIWSREFSRFSTSIPPRCIKH